MKNFHRLINNPVKLVIFAISLIIILAVPSFIIADNVLSQQSNKELGIEKGVDIALANSGFEESQVSNLSATYTNKGTSPAYEIKFETDSHKYSYVLNTHTGDILSFSKNLIDENDPIENTTSSLINLDKAKSIAISDAQLDASNVLFKKTKLDQDDGVYLYEIEFNYENLSYEYEIDAYSGKIIEKDIDD